jgi:hypothetical protein
MNTWVKQIPHSPRQRTPMEAISMLVEDECSRLIDEETYDEKGMDLEVAQSCQRLTGMYLDHADRWDTALVDAVYSLKEGEIVELLSNGDDAELGKRLRELAIKSFAKDVFDDAETETLT